jgi:hypothetical protein
MSEEPAETVATDGETDTEKKEDSTLENNE